MVFLTEYVEKIYLWESKDKNGDSWKLNILTPEAKFKISYYLSLNIERWNVLILIKKLLFFLYSFPLVYSF